MEKYIGPNIKKYLKERGITQSFIAKKVGISEEALSRILKGTRNIFAEEYFLICEVLDVPFDTFYMKGGA